MRAIWKGSINFGLVYIPVSVYPATKEEKISFRQLRATDLSPISIQESRRSRSEGSAGGSNRQRVRVRKGKWITLRDEDFEKSKSNPPSVEITDFVDQAQINPKFFTNRIFSNRKRRRESVRTFAQGADHVGEGRGRQGGDPEAGIPRGGQTGRALLDPGADAFCPGSPGACVAQQRRGPRRTSPQELKMATALIDAMTTEWEPTKYRDQYQTALDAADRRKGSETRSCGRADGAAGST